MREDKIKEGLEKAYEKVGPNAYFEPGFRAGIDFALSQDMLVELRNDLYRSQQNNIALKQELIETRERLGKACEAVASTKTRTLVNKELFGQLFNTALTAFWLYDLAPQVPWILTAFLILIMWMLVTPYTED